MIINFTYIICHDYNTLLFIEGMIQLMFEVSFIFFKYFLTFSGHINCHCCLKQNEVMHLRKTFEISFF